MLVDILLDQTTQALARQAPDGAMPPGQNGAYGDPETPIRNTSHWLVSFCHAYRATGDARFKAAAELCLAYLLGRFGEVRGSMICRNSAGKDQSNGVLGQAQVVEALYEAWVTFGSAEAREAAIALIKRHPFNAANFCWNRVTSDGVVFSPDFTFNHQLYYAATISLWAQEDSAVAADLDRFVKGLRYTLRTRPGGRIAHDIINRSSARTRLASFVNENKALYLGNLAKKETDYHCYNLYAFSLLHERVPDFVSVVPSKWKSVLAFSSGDEIQARLKPAAWGGKLRSGTETLACDFAYFRKRFYNDDSAAPIERAAEFLTFHAGPAGDFSQYSPDPVTQTARIYRYWRII